MIKKYYPSRFYLLVVLFNLSVYSSCTYDYFEDETNYVVYAPKANKEIRTQTYCIEDINIFIYNGDLKKERYSQSPFAENARSLFGNFNFRLYPGNYSVYCFTNMGETRFYDLSLHSLAKFELQQYADGFYKEPSAIYGENKTPVIHFPGPLVSDTAWFDAKYVGTIGLAFKNLTKINPSLTPNNISKIEIEASGVGVVQYLSALTNTENTRSARYSENDKMRLVSKISDINYKDFDFGIQNYYFPSPNLSAESRENEPIYLKLNFIGANDNVLASLEIPVIDKRSEALVLHMNETLIIEVDGNNIQILRLQDPEQWNPNIEPEGNSGPGSGGIDL